MSERKTAKCALNTLWTITAFVGVGLVGCYGGDTDGGKGNDNLGNGDQFVSDGGSGAKIELDAPHDIDVGERAAFTVQLNDPTGAPLSFVRVFCESEKGIAIIEPSSGGVAFEHTNARGTMSGVIGGLSEGSYLFECRAPEGYNLVARKTLFVHGPGPADFAGFPGAAGGNLGGGVIVDGDPDSETGVVVSKIEFADAGGTTEHGPIDTAQDPDCDDTTTGNQPEPFTFTNFTITVTNNSTRDVTIDTVKFKPSSASTTTLSVASSVAVGATTTITGLFIDFPGNVQSFVGSGDAVPSEGTRTITFTVSGSDTQTGDSFSSSGSASLTFDQVDNCTS